MSENIWKALAAPLPSNAIEWRIDSKPTARDGKFFARFVPYVTTQYVRERFDAVVPGLWTSKVTREANADGIDKKTGEVTSITYVYHAAITVGGADGEPVTREDVGEGDSPKVAATDAFKRAAMRFGIAHELYSFGQNWVQVDGDGKFAKAVEDPQAAYLRKQSAVPHTADTASVLVAAETRRAKAAPTVAFSEQDKADARAAMGLTKPAGDALACPSCEGTMWDNRPKKESGAFKPNAPDWSCKDKACGGKWWKDSDGRKEPEPKPEPTTYASITGAMDDDDGTLPFSQGLR